MATKNNDGSFLFDGLEDAIADALSKKYDEGIAKAQKEVQKQKMKIKKIESIIEQVEVTNTDQVVSETISQLKDAITDEAKASKPIKVKQKVEADVEVTVPNKTIANKTVDQIESATKGKTAKVKIEVEPYLKADKKELQKQVKEWYKKDMDDHTPSKAKKFVGYYTAAKQRGVEFSKNESREYDDIYKYYLDPSTLVSTTIKDERKLLEDLLKIRDQVTQGIEEQQKAQDKLNTSVEKGNKIQKEGSKIGKSKKTEQKTADTPITSPQPKGKDKNGILSGTTDTLRKEIERLENEVKSDSGTGILQSILFGKDGHIKMPSTILKEIEDIEKEIYARLDKDIFADISDLMDSKFKKICVSYTEGLLSLDEINSVSRTKVWTDTIVDECNRLGLNNIYGDFDHLDETAIELSNLIAKAKELDSLQSSTQSHQSGVLLGEGDSKTIKNSTEDIQRFVDFVNESQDKILGSRSTSFWKKNIKPLAEDVEQNIISAEEAIKRINNLISFNQLSRTGGNSNSGWYTQLEEHLAEQLLNGTERNPVISLEEAMSKLTDGSKFSPNDSDQKAIGNFSNTNIKDYIRDWQRLQTVISETEDSENRFEQEINNAAKSEVSKIENRLKELGAVWDSNTGRWVNQTEVLSGTTKLIERGSTQLEQSVEQKIALEVQRLRELRDSGKDISKLPFGELNKFGDGTLGTLEKINAIIFGNSPIEEAVNQIMALHKESLKLKDTIEELFKKYNVTDSTPYENLFTLFKTSDADTIGGMSQSEFLERLEKQIIQNNLNIAKFTEDEVVASLKNIQEYFNCIEQDSDAFIQSIEKAKTTAFLGQMGRNGKRTEALRDGAFTMLESYMAMKGNDLSGTELELIANGKHFKSFLSTGDRKSLMIRMLFGNMSQDDIVSIMKGEFSQIISKLSSSIIPSSELKELDPEEYIKLEVNKVRSYLQENFPQVNGTEKNTYINDIYNNLTSSEEVIQRILKDYKGMAYAGEEVEKTQSGCLRLISDIGLTKNELLEKIRKENEEIESGNRLYQERITLLKDGKVIDSFIGEHDKVNAEISNKNNYADEILHTHPNIDKTLGLVPAAQDLQNLLALENVKSFVMSVGDKLSTLSLPNGLEKIKELLPQYKELFNLFRTAVKNGTGNNVLGQYAESFLKYIAALSDGEFIKMSASGDILGISNIDPSELDLILKVIDRLVSLGGDLGQGPTTTEAFDLGLTQLSGKFVDDLKETEIQVEKTMDAIKEVNQSGVLLGDGDTKPQQQYNDELEKAKKLTDDNVSSLYEFIKLCQEQARVLGETNEELKERAGYFKGEQISGKVSVGTHYSGNHDSSILEGADTDIHSHFSKYASFSEEDLYNLRDQLKNFMVMGTDELTHFDTTGLSKEIIQSIIVRYDILVKELNQQFLNNLSIKDNLKYTEVEDIPETIMVQAFDFAQKSADIDYNYNKFDDFFESEIEKLRQKLLEGASLTDIVKTAEEDIQRFEVDGVTDEVKSFREKFVEGIKGYLSNILLENDVFNPDRLLNLKEFNEGRNNALRTVLDDLGVGSDRLKTIDISNLEEGYSSVLKVLESVITKQEEVIRNAEDNKTPLLSEDKTGEEVQETADEIEKADEQIEESNEEVTQSEEKLAQATVESRDKASKAAKKHAKEQKKLSDEVLAELKKIEEEQKQVFSDESFSDRDIVSQNGLKEVRRELGRDGEMHDVGNFSFLERLQDGQLQNVLVTYDETTGRWYEQVMGVSTAFEQVGKEVISLDDKIKKYEMDRDKQLAAHPSYDTSADEKLISLAKDRQKVLLDTLEIYHEDEEYAYKMNEFEEKRAENTKRLNALEQKNSNLLQAKADEKSDKETEKRNAEITKANRLLNTQEKTLERIERTYNKAVNPDLEKSVTNQNDLTELERKKQEILTLINKLKNSPRDASNEQEYLKLEKMIAAYKDLADSKKKANNPTKAELGGQNLKTLISIQINDYKKLIDRAKVFGDVTEENVQRLEEQLKILETVDNNGNYTATANDYYSARDLLKVEKSNIGLLESQQKDVDEINAMSTQSGKLLTLIKQGKAGTTEYRELLKTIVDVINLQNKYTEEVNESTDSIDRLVEASEAFKTNFIKDFDINKTKILDGFDVTFKRLTNDKNFNVDDTGIKNTVAENLNALKNFKLGDNIEEDAKTLVNIINEINNGIHKLKAIPKEDLLPDASELNKDLGNINKVLAGGYKMSGQLRQSYMALQKAYEDAFDSNGNVKITNKELQKMRDILSKVNAEFDATGRKKSLFGSFGQRLTDMNTKFLAQYFSFQDIIRYGRQAFETIKEYDTALTEMNKVSDESIKTLKEFQKESFELANAIGTTASQIQKSTADWMRLGYSLQAAAELAQDANIYAHVGDMDIDTATEHMISSVQAWKSEFKNEIEASEAIVDRYNEIGKIMPPYIVIYR